MGLFADNDSYAAQFYADSQLDELMDEMTADAVRRAKSQPQDGDFFILWNPASHLPPRVRFTDEAKAFAAAERMAKQHGGEFFVMKMTGRAKRHEIIAVERRGEACLHGR